MGRKPFNRKDRFYFKAKKEGYPARSAYKIIEIDQKWQVFKPGRVIVDLGCAPGGWLKVAHERVGPSGKVIGIDLLPIQVSEASNLHYRQDDFTSAESQTWIEELIPDKAHWILSDMSPNISGIKFRDTLESYELCHKAFEFAKKNLKPQGGFVCKIFPGSELEEFRKEIQGAFKKVKTVIPDSTRNSSTEIYIVAKELKS